MDWTLREIKGTRVNNEGTVVTIVAESVDGSQVEIDLLPEMIMDLVLTLMTVKTEAWVRSEAGVPGAIPDETDPMRRLILASRAVQIPQPGNKRLIQISTDQGAIFEFLLPSTAEGRG